MPAQAASAEPRAATPSAITVTRIGAPAQEAVVLASLAMAEQDEERARFILENLMKRHHLAIAELAPWEMLFDLHHHREDRAAFEALAQAYQRALGLPPPDYTTWPKPDTGDLARTRPRLLQELTARWQTPEAAFALLQGAVAETTRPGRPPLTAPQAVELVFLHDIMAQVVQSMQANATQETAPRRATPTFSAFSALEERYMRIAREVVTLWPRPECRQFLESLIVDDRVSRQGFAEDVLSELVFLRQVLDEVSFSQA